MKNKLLSSILYRWSPARQWLIPLGILLIAIGILGFDGDVHWAYYIVFVSMLLFACINPVMNALTAGLGRNIGLSILFFGFHSTLCYFVLLWCGRTGELVDLRFFMVILVFFFIATMLAALYRGIYIMLEDM